MSIVEISSGAIVEISSRAKPGQTGKEWIVYCNDCADRVGTRDTALEAIDRARAHVEALHCEPTGDTESIR